MLRLTAVVRLAVRRRLRSLGSHADVNLEPAVHGVRDGSSDTNAGSQVVAN